MAAVRSLGHAIATRGRKRSRRSGMKNGTRSTREAVVFLCRLLGLEFHVAFEDLIVDQRC
jgi:hypothetical protein